MPETLGSVSSTEIKKKKVGILAYLTEDWGRALFLIICNMCVTLLTFLKPYSILLESTTVLLLEVKSFPDYLKVLFCLALIMFICNNRCCLFPYHCSLLSDWLLCSYEKENLCHGGRIIWKTVWVCGVLRPKDPAMDRYLSTEREKVNECGCGLYWCPYCWVSLMPLGLAFASLFCQTNLLTWHLLTKERATCAWNTWVLPLKQAVKDWSEVLSC
jgi:hypothetical protein